MSLGTEEKVVVSALVIAFIVMFGAWGNAYVLFAAWALMIPVGGWYGLRKAKSWNRRHGYA